MIRHSRGLILCAFLGIAGCTNGPAKTPPPAAEKPKAESELAITTLSKEAVVSLEIKTEKVTAQDVDEYLSLTGWIMARPGQEVTLTAPAAGYVQFPEGQSVPIPGASVKADQLLLQLKPVFSPVEKIQVDALQRSIKSDLIKAQTTLKTATREYDRTVTLLKEKARNEQDLEIAKKAVDHAAEEVEAATEKLTFFQLRSIALKAPHAGKVLQLHAGPGQYVPVSAPLITLINLDPVWIRVAVPEYDLPNVDPSRNVKITWKNPNHAPLAKSPFLDAKPVGRVVQVDPNKHTADLWYELEPTKEAGRFVKDQMVTVRVPIVGKKEKGTVVPYSAVVFDAHGNTWIYLDRKTGKDPEEFERRWVDLVTAVDGGIVVRPALADGKYVVTHGAAALFSREFHRPPVKVAAEGK